NSLTMYQASRREGKKPKLIMLQPPLPPLAPAPHETWASLRVVGGQFARRTIRARRSADRRAGAQERDTSRRLRPRAPGGESTVRASDRDGRVTQSGRHIGSPC